MSNNGEYPVLVTWICGKTLLIQPSRSKFSKTWDVGETSCYDADVGGTAMPQDTIVDGTAEPVASRKQTNQLQHQQQTEAS